MAKKQAKKPGMRRRQAIPRRIVEKKVEEIIDDVRFDAKGGLVTIAIPAETKNGDIIPNRGRWVRAAMQQLADLFRGASAFSLHTGIYKHENGEYQFEDSVFVQSFATRDLLLKEETISSLVRFCYRMRRDTDQASVLLAVNETAFFIEEDSHAS